MGEPVAGVVGLILFTASTLSTVVSAVLMNRGSNQAQERRRGVQSNAIDTQLAVPVIYGRRRVGIKPWDMALAGSDNRYLHIIGVLCEGPIEGVVQVDGVDQIFLDGKLYTEFGDKVYYEIFTGEADQALCASYAAVKPEWDSALPYTAYIYLRLTYDPDLFQSRPEVVVEVDGLKIYNPDTAVTEYSNNAALCAYDFMSRSARRGGMEIAASRIDDTTVIDSAAYCTAKGWTCDIVLSEMDTVAIDHLAEILATYRGAIIRAATTFTFKYLDLNYETSVMDITEDDIIEENGRSSLTIRQPSVFDTPNALKLKYYNSEKEYAEDELIIADSAAAASDGDYREKEVSLTGMTATENVQKMGNYLLERLRINKEAGMIIGTRGMALEPMDLVTVTHSRPAWFQKFMRVSELSVTQSGDVGLQLIEESDDMYDDIYNLAAHDFHDTNLPDPGAAVPGVLNVTNSEELYNYRGRTWTRWKIDFDPPLAAVFPWWDHADVYIKRGDDGDWKYMTTAKLDFVLDPVEEGVTYYCRLVSVSIWGTKQAFADGITVSRYIQGKTSAPGNVTGFTALAHADSISLFADELSDPDIAGYEIRLGDAWDGGLLIGFNETPNVRLNGVRPSPTGTPHTFWIAAKDNSGNYSGTPASTQVAVFYPPGYSNKNTWSWDFNAIGTFANAEHATYEGGDTLKCSHTGNVLTGTWLSPEYDLGSAKTVRIWGDFLTTLSAAGGTWDALFPGTTKWEDKITSTTRWYELLSPAYAGIIRAKLKWGLTSGDLDYEADKLEILAPEIYARYVQVEITIIDPDAASNLYLKELNMIAAYWS